MYRYSVDDAVTYTSEDFVLFRESPFACWMERLTLENPDHGIPPDVGSVPPRNSIEPQDDMADTLRAEGKNVRLIDWDADEPERRRATLEAMRKGVDFIVNGQLALGPLSGTANLLMRTSGYSELGDFLYIPCDTQAKSSAHSAFRLSFLADLLHSLQGQLPPQMLVIRGGEDLMPLQTDSHIYHYRAVKQRFMEAMRSFRKHRMPDPAESAHFGRWSDCAHEVLKQRLLREEQISEEITDEDYAKPLLQAAGGSTGSDAVAEGEGEGEQSTAHLSPPARTAVVSSRLDRGTDGVSGGFTLAEQAHMLSPGAYKPGPGVYRLGPPRTPGTSAARSNAAAAAVPAAADKPPAATEPSATGRPKYNRRASDKALQNLEFIGSNPRAGGLGLDTAPALDTSPMPPPGAVPESAAETSRAPAPSLRAPGTLATARTTGWASDSGAGVSEPDIPATAESSPAAGTIWDVPESESVSAPDRQEMSRPAPGDAPPVFDRDAVDRDATHLPSPPPGLTTSEGFSPDDSGIEEHPVEHRFGQAAPERSASRKDFAKAPFRERANPDQESDSSRFSNSLITSDDYED